MSSIHEFTKRVTVQRFYLKFSLQLQSFCAEQIPTWLPQFRYKINYAENLDVGEYVTMFNFAFCIQQGYDLFTLVNISWLTMHTHEQKCPKPK